MNRIKNIYQLFHFILNYGFDSFSIFTHLTIEERLILFYFGKQSDSIYPFVEIGSYLGASAHFLAYGIKSRDIENKKLYCIDTWHNEGMAEGFRDTWEEFNLNIEPLKLIIIPLRGDSVDVGKRFTQNISLIFVDGDHEYNGCHGDIQSWFPHLIIGGRIIFHDIGWAEGVQKVVEELYSAKLISKPEIYKNICWATKIKEL